MVSLLGGYYVTRVMQVHTSSSVELLCLVRRGIPGFIPLEENDVRTSLAGAPAHVVGYLV